MCFALYIAADQEIPTILWYENDRRLNTRDLAERDEAVSVHFKEPFKKYLGSDLGCGCGFRYAMFQSGSWPEEEMIGLDGDSGEEQQTNHLQLHQLLSELSNHAERIELYGCWEGDFAVPSEGASEIPLSRIIDRTFFFRERFLYRITKGEPE